MGVDPQAAIATGFLLCGPDMQDINLAAERRTRGPTADRLGPAREVGHHAVALGRIEIHADVHRGLLRLQLHARIDDAGDPRPVGDRDRATDAVTAIAAAMGVWAVRVHDVAGSRDAVRVAEAWRRGSAHG